MTLLLLQDLLHHTLKCSSLQMLQRIKKRVKQKRYIYSFEK